MIHSLVGCLISGLNNDFMHGLMRGKCVIKGISKLKKSIKKP